MTGDTDQVIYLDSCIDVHIVHVCIITVHAEKMLNIVEMKFDIRSSSASIPVLRTDSGLVCVMMQCCVNVVDIRTYTIKQYTTIVIHGRFLIGGNTRELLQIDINAIIMALCVMYVAAGNI